MNLRSLRTLVEIDDIGSFAVAADRLGLTLSTVSAQMKVLEDELRLELFDRSHRPPAMTPMARQVVTHARAILRQADAIRAIGTGPEELQGIYRIGFVATASVRLMPGFLANAAAAQPMASFLVERGLSTILLRKLRSGNLDAAVVTETDDLAQDMVFSPLCTERFVIATPSGAPTGLAKSLRTMRFVQFTPTTGIGALVDTYLRGLKLTPKDTLILDSVEAVMGCVNAGVGFAILPEPDAQRYATTASLKVLDKPPLVRRLGLAIPQNSPIAEQASTIAALFQENGAPAPKRRRAPR